MGAAVAADQMRRAAAHAVMARAFGHGFDQGRMIGETEIVIAAEGQQIAAIDADVRRAGRIDGAYAPAQMLAFQRREFLTDVVEQLHAPSVSLRAACVPLARCTSSSSSST